jgi:ParB family transcriptional regulator, chromosome partitioning protein
VRPNKYQPRSTIDPGALARLADSLRQSGVMQPIAVRRITPVGQTKYELVAGERRWRAAALAGLDRVPAVVHDLSDEESAQWAVVENLQREDLNPIERATAFRVLCDTFGLSQAEVAQRVGLDRTSVTNLLRLMDLPDKVRDMVADGRLSAGHGKALLAVQDEGRMARLAERASAEGWSVRRLETATQTPAGGVGETGLAEEFTPAAANPHTLNLLALERQLGEHLGTKVKISADRGGKKGRLTIEFYGLDHFDGLMARLGFQMK